jgi:hypothetical protein
MTRDQVVSCVLASLSTVYGHVCKEGGSHEEVCRVSFARPARRAAVVGQRMVVLAHAVETTMKRETLTRREFITVFCWAHRHLRGTSWTDLARIASEMHGYNVSVACIRSRVAHYVKQVERKHA